MNSTVLSVLIALALIGGAVLLTSGKADTPMGGNNVSLVDGVQVITISAKGGYSPKVTNAKAGVPTVLEMETSGTFDCSSALTIPSIGYHQTLPPSGKTRIELPPQEAGKTVQGLCSMGMYSFAVTFN